MARERAGIAKVCGGAVVILLRDELQVLKEPGRRAQDNSYLWAQMTVVSGKDEGGPPIRLFGYSPSRSTEKT